MSNTDLITNIIIIFIGSFLGSASTLITKSILDKRRERFSLIKVQLKDLYSPLEILVRINGMEFDRYFKTNASKHDRQFIEQRIWYPNHLQIKEILMKNSHLLEHLPSEFLKLLAHINVWLSEYDLVYVKKEKDPPVFAGPKGYHYPKEVDEYIYKKARELRKKVNEKRYF